MEVVDVPRPREDVRGGLEEFPPVVPDDGRRPVNDRRLVDDARLVLWPVVELLTMATVPVRVLLVLRRLSLR